MTAFHHLIGGTNFPILQVPLDDDRIGDQTLNPIGFTFEELNLLLVDIKRWSITATATDSDGNDLEPVWWNNSDDYQLPGNVLLNNNIWAIVSENSDAEWTYPFGGSDPVNPYWDNQQKTAISNGFGLFNTENLTRNGCTLLTFGSTAFLGTPIIYFDGTLYWPPIVLNMSVFSYSGDLEFGQYASTYNPVIADAPICGTITLLGKTGNVFWQGSPEVGAVDFEIDINSRW